jgi:hypothetical protein
LPHKPILFLFLLALEVRLPSLQPQKPMSNISLSFTKLRRVATTGVLASAADHRNRVPSPSHGARSLELRRFVDWAISLLVLAKIPDRLQKIPCSVA